MYIVFQFIFSVCVGIFVFGVYLLFVTLYIWFIFIICEFEYLSLCYFQYLCELLEMLSLFTTTVRWAA